jgi:hypothetical protein
LRAACWFEKLVRNFCDGTILWPFLNHVNWKIIRKYSTSKVSSKKYKYSYKDPCVYTFLREGWRGEIMDMIGILN